MNLNPFTLFVALLTSATLFAEDVEVRLMSCVEKGQSPLVFSPENELPPFTFLSSKLVKDMTASDSEGFPKLKLLEKRVILVVADEQVNKVIPESIGLTSYANVKIYSSPEGQ